MLHGAQCNDGTGKMKNVNMTQLANSSPQPATPLHVAEELTKGGIRADISLGEKVYTLRITRSGKLILTKRTRNRAAQLPSDI